MPEFRFRRKKKKQQSSRRHTVHDAEEAQAQVAAARKMVSQEQVREGMGVVWEGVDGVWEGLDC